MGNPISGAIGGAAAGTPLGPLGSVLGGAAGLLSGLFGGSKPPKIVPEDPRLAPTVVDMFSQMGMTGADRAAALNPLMEAVRAKLYSAFGQQAPPPMSRPNVPLMGNEAAIGGNTYERPWEDAVSPIRRKQQQAQEEEDSKNNLIRDARSQGRSNGYILDALARRAKIPVASGPTPDQGFR